MLNLGTVAVVGSENFHPDNKQSKLFTLLFERLATLGVTLRTSGTEGLEYLALTQYVQHLNTGDIAPTQLEVYLPWRRYNTMVPAGQCYHCVTVDNFAKAIPYVRKVKPDFTKGTHKAKLFQAKNVFLTFGRSLDKPVDFLITATPMTNDNIPMGLSSTAVLFANLKNIPVFNFYESSSFEETFRDLLTFLNGLGYPIRATANYGSRAVTT